MTHLLPDVPLLVFVFHVLALILLFGQTFISFARRYKLKKQLRELGNAVKRPQTPFYGRDMRDIQQGRRQFNS
jgi:hypothetical protein